MRKVDCSAIVKSLEACSAVTEQGELELMASTDIEVPGYHKYANDLYEVLVKYSSCVCIEQGESGNHWTRIRLSPEDRLAEDKTVRFTMLFSVSPNPSLEELLKWQHVQIDVPSTYV